MNAQDNMKLIQDQRDILIQARTIEERKMEEFASRIHSVNVEEVFGDIYIPPVISLKAFCPEAYKELPDPDVYQKEYDKMIEIIAPINERMRKINQEASECVAQFRQMK